MNPKPPLLILALFTAAVLIANPIEAAWFNASYIEMLKVNLMEIFLAAFGFVIGFVCAKVRYQGKGG